VLIEGGTSHKISTFELKGGAGEGAYGEGKLQMGTSEVGN
jgi:hypothetical protein